MWQRTSGWTAALKSSLPFMFSRRVLFKSNQLQTTVVLCSCTEALWVVSPINVFAGYRSVCSSKRVQPPVWVGGLNPCERLTAEKLETELHFKIRDFLRVRPGSSHSQWDEDAEGFMWQRQLWLGGSLWF